MGWVDDFKKNHTLSKNKSFKNFRKGSLENRVLCVHLMLKVVALHGIFIYFFQHLNVNETRGV